MPRTGFSNGLFELYQLPEFTPLQALSISQECITAAAFNSNGDWLALGCARLGQLLVWEWASEGYVLRQQGHFFDVGCAGYSPDGALIATGADDAKVGCVAVCVTCSHSCVAFPLAVCESHCVCLSLCA